MPWSNTDVYLLTLDLDHLLHLWVSLEHTLVLSTEAVGDLLQAATQMEAWRTCGSALAMHFNSSTATLMTRRRFPLSRVENVCLGAWGKKLCVHAWPSQCLFCSGLLHTALAALSKGQNWGQVKWAQSQWHLALLPTPPANLLVLLTHPRPAAAWTLLLPHEQQRQQ